MKLYTTLLVIILIGSISCKKHVTAENEHIFGDYEWYYSFDGFYTSVYQDDTEDKWGIRIKKSGKIILYNSGDKEETYKIATIKSDENERFVIKAIQKESEVELIYQNNELTLENWPFKAFTNQFQAHN